MIRLLSFSFLLFVAYMAHAQVAIDSTRAADDNTEPKALPQSTTQPPQYQDDVVQAEHDIHEIKSSAQYGRAVDRKELPTRVKRALRQSTYKGWQEGTIYYDETRNVYTIIISSQNRYYRLNDQGEPWRE